MEDRRKTTFTTEWGCFQYTVMPFGLKNAPTIFSRVVIAAFKEFIHKFLEVYFDDWTILCALLHTIRAYCVQTGSVGGSCEDNSHCELANAKKNETTVHDTWRHWILHKV